MQQLSLFPELEIKLPPCIYITDFLPKEDANMLLKHCHTLDWQQNQIRMLGKILPVPRLENIHGDPGCDYLYSGQILLQPQPWTSELQVVRGLVEKAARVEFNIVIGNLYRDGSDSIGWHSDDERSMGINPVIASVSLGATRKFQIRSKANGNITNLWLEHGSLLIMQSGCQNDWKHQLPKTKVTCGPRVNLTFRPHLRGAKC